MALQSEYPLVTLVTPTYNQSDFLAETIESVLAQNYPNIQYIVVNDGSTDATADVLSGYAGRVQIITQSNLGQAAALNRGWGAANGEIFGYLSSDDKLKEGCVSSLCAALVSNPNISVVYPDFELINEHGDTLRTIKTEEYNLRRLNTELVCQPGVGALFRRSSYDLVGGWNPQLKQVPDYDFWLRMSKTGEMMRVAEVLGQYRIHEESASYRPVSRERAREIIKVVSGYWGDDLPPAAKSTAHVITAMHHLRSGRVALGLLSYLAAVSFSPRTSLSTKNVRTIGSGLLRRALRSAGIMK